MPERSLVSRTTSVDSLATPRTNQEAHAVQQLHCTSRLGFNFSYSVPLKKSDASLNSSGSMRCSRFHRGRVFTILSFRDDKEGRLRDVVLNCWQTGACLDCLLAGRSYHQRAGYRRGHVCDGPDHWDHSASTTTLRGRSFTTTAERKPVLVQRNNRRRTPFFR